MNPLAKILVITGLTLFTLGLLLYFLPSLPLLGKLPGDFHIERPRFRLFFPLTTCLLLSILISTLLWFLSKSH